MTSTTRTLSLAGSVADRARAARRRRCRPGRAHRRRGPGDGEMLRHLAGRQERLRRRPRHHLRRHLQGRLPGQRLEATCPKGTCADDPDAVRRRARSSRSSAPPEPIAGAEAARAGPARCMRRSDAAPMSIPVTGLPASPASASSPSTSPTSWPPRARRRLLRGACRELHGRRRRRRTPCSTRIRERYRALGARRRAVDRRRRAARPRAPRAAAAARASAMRPRVFSEHLAWSSHDGDYLNDLLPLPYTDADARARLRPYRRGAERRSAGGCCSRTPRPTSPSPSSTMGEIEFLAEIVAPHRLRPPARRQQRLRLGDQPRLRRRSPISTISRSSAVGEIHLGGHAEDRD